MPMAAPESSETTISIGALSRETGISIESLRMWERRYGSPKSIRLPSGHRRYPLPEVERLRLAAKALEKGFRAGDVAPATVDVLMLMLESGVRGKAARGMLEAHVSVPKTEQTPEADPSIDRWMRAVEGFDDKALTDGFYRDWAELGPMRFLQERIVPFLRRLGDDWMNGEIAISHEHFASEQTGDFLSGMWRRMNERSLGRGFLVASLPGDLHRLGLQMASLMIALAEAKVIYIGPQTPPREIVASASRFHPTAVCLSVSSSVATRDAATMVTQLRMDLPESIPIVVGGMGAPEPIPGVVRIQDLKEFFEWVRERGRQP